MNVAEDEENSGKYLIRNYNRRMFNIVTFSLRITHGKCGFFCYKYHEDGALMLYVHSFPFFP